MASCEDCIHYLVCECSGGELYESVELLRNDCSTFKNKADVVEVVRCKDCRSWEEGGFDPILNHRFGYCRHYQWQDNEYCDRETNDNDYCSYGEKALKEREKE